MERLYAHLDIRNFYARCEQLLNRKYKSSPLVVYNEGPTGKRAIIAASKEAKAFGIDRSSFVNQAERLGIITIKSRIEKYWEISDKIFMKFAPDLAGDGYNVAKPHVDDIVVESTYDFLKIFKAAERVKKFYKKHGFEMSAGISFNRDFAHMATKWAKEYGMIYFPRWFVKEFIYKEPIKEFPGIGEKLEIKFHEKGIETITDIANSSRETMLEIVGTKKGVDIYDSIVSAKG